MRQLVSALVLFATLAAGSAQAANVLASGNSFDNSNATFNANLAQISATFTFVAPAAFSGQSLAGYNAVWLACSRHSGTSARRLVPSPAMDFAEMQKLNIKAHVDAKMDEAWVGYQMIAGAQNGTFLFFQVSSSLAEEEGSEKAHKAMREAAGAEFAAADAEFWTPKPAAAGPAHGSHTTRFRPPSLAK